MRPEGARIIVVVLFFSPSLFRQTAMVTRAWATTTTVSGKRARALDLSEENLARKRGENSLNDLSPMTKNTATHFECWTELR